MHEQAGTRATRRLVVLAAMSLAAAIAGLVLAPHALVIAAIVAAPAIITIALAWRRLERSLVGEIAAAATLSGASAPVLVAAGSSLYEALLLWGAWATGYACTVIAVHRVIARNRAPAAWPDALASIVLAGTTIAGVALLARGSVLGAATPLAIGSLGLVVRPPRATYLRTIGVALVIASVATGAAAFVVLR